MKRIIYAILLSSYCFTCLNGQDYSAKLVGNIRGDYYIWETREHKLKQTHSLVRLDPSMKISIRTDPGTLLSRNERIEQIMLLGNRIVLFTLMSETKPGISCCSLSMTIRKSLI